MDDELREAEEAEEYAYRLAWEEYETRQEIEDLGLCESET